jgi:hypothetical protein
MNAAMEMLRNRAQQLYDAIAGESNIELQIDPVEAVELDAFAKEIPDLVFHGTTAYSMFKNEATKIPG